MSKHVMIGNLKPGKWFRFPDDKERWMIIDEEDETGERQLCVSLQTGITWSYAKKLCVYRVSKTRG